MEFNVVDENNKFKIGDIISIFKLPKYSNEFVLFSVSDYDVNEGNLHVAYLLKDSDGYDYIDEITDSSVLKDTTEAVKEMLNVIN